MRRVVYIVSLTVGVFMVTFLAFRAAKVRSQDPPLRSFVATLSETRYKPDGSIFTREDILHAVSRDRSQVDVFRKELPDGRWEYLRKILNVSAGLDVMVEPATGSAVTMPMGKEQLELLTRPALNCGAAVNAPRKTILGYAVVRWSTELPLPDNQSVRTEEWRAPALGCYPLYDRSEMGPKSGPSAYNVREVLFVVEGEPPSAFFEVASDLTERSPSQADFEFERFFPGHHLYLEGGARADRRYYGSRAATPNK
ncbi:MAG: hypothetical protein DMG27_00405 [Acidobacteria bacterium]|nr:MAG: hypothetical protein DMG27_00405 [Acidobacteriota bacterium]